MIAKVIGWVCAIIVLTFGLFFLYVFIVTAPFRAMAEESEARAEQGHPSDAVLEQKFLAHEKDFKALKHLFLTDGKNKEVVSVDTRENMSPPSLPNAKKYFDLFSKLGVEVGDIYKGREITLYVSSYGFLLAGSYSKGYFYSASKPKEESSLKHTISYVPLKDNWYIFEEENL